MSIPSLRRRRAPRGSGDKLREEILDAATDLLLEKGNAKAVSIRAVAQRVGVTPPSIYLHFADKDTLLDAVCGRYFESLYAEMLRACDGCDTTIEVLRAQGLAYVRFALQNAELYRIATMGEGRPGSNVDATLASSAFVLLRQSVQELIDERVFAALDASTVALELFTAAHGVAALMIAKPYLPFGDAEQFADRLFRSVCCGYIVAGLVGTDASPAETVQWLMARGSGQEVG